MADRPPFRHNQPTVGGRVVRASHMDRILMLKDAETHLKFMNSIQAYDDLLIEPIRQRLDYLEMWPWQKIWFHLKDFGRWIRSLTMEPVPDLKEGEQVIVPNPDGTPTSDQPMGEAQITKVGERDITIDTEHKDG